MEHLGGMELSYIQIIISGVINIIIPKNKMSRALQVRPSWATF